MVRQRTLTPSFQGSNPCTPAKEKRAFSLAKDGKADALFSLFGGIRNYAFRRGLNSINLHMFAKRAPSGSSLTVRPAALFLSLSYISSRYLSSETGSQHRFPH